MLVATKILDLKPPRAGDLFQVPPKQSVGMEAGVREYNKLRLSDRAAQGCYRCAPSSR
jgi:hypothetical protein